MVASHTPDACWPGSGWTAPARAPGADPGHRRPAHAGRRPRRGFFTLGDDPQHVWFWHLYDGQPIAYSDPYSPTELLRIAWRYGFRRDGDQLFVRVSSNRPWDEIAARPPLAQFLPQRPGHRRAPTAPASRSPISAHAPARHHARKTHPRRSSALLIVLGPDRAVPSL
jgi:hypothetical protein